MEFADGGVAGNMGGQILRAEIPSGKVVINVATKTARVVPIAVALRI